MKFMQELEMNGSCTISKFNITNGGNQVTLSKWSLGCYSQSKSFLGSSFGQCTNQFGINVGTPTYLQSGANGLDSDKKPTVCEFSCLLNLYGFNVPMYFDFINNKTVGDTSYNNLNNNPTTSGTGNACVFGIRPSNC